MFRADDVGRGARARFWAKSGPIRLWNLAGFGPLSLRLDNFVGNLPVYQRACLSSCVAVREPLPERPLPWTLPGSPIWRVAFCSDGLRGSHSQCARRLFISDQLGVHVDPVLFPGELRTEPANADSRAGYIMLAMSEAGFLCIVLAFLIAGRTASDFSFPALAAVAAQLSTQCRLGCVLVGLSGVRGQGRAGAGQFLVAAMLYR